MKHRTLSRTKLRRGFTLLELLLVLVILVVIAGFGIQAFTSTRERAKMQQAKITLGMLSTSLKQYQMEVNTLPSALEALHVMPSDITDPNNWVKKLDKPVPKDPWEHPYEYKVNGSEFDLRSVGPDGQSGTTDDITP